MPCSERRLWRTISVSAFDTPAFTGERVSEATARRSRSANVIAAFAVPFMTTVNSSPP